MTLLLFARNVVRRAESRPKELGFCPKPSHLIPNRLQLQNGVALPGAFGCSVYSRAICAARKRSDDLTPEFCVKVMLFIASSFAERRNSNFQSSEASGHLRMPATMQNVESNDFLRPRASLSSKRSPEEVVDGTQDFL